MVTRKDDVGASTGRNTWRGANLRTRLLLAYCRKLPIFRGKGRIYRWSAAALLHNELLLKDSFGIRLGIDASDFIGWRMAFGGAYEPLSLALARKIMSGGGTFIDVGSNVGLYSMSMAALPGVRAVAIDASFDAMGRLASNLRRNTNITCLDIVHGAIGSQPGVESFGTPLRNNLGSTRVTYNQEADYASRFWATRTTMQILLERLDVQRVRLVKIDVEGLELEVLKGMCFAGSQRPENIIMECEPEFPQAEECLAFLRAQGYRIRSVTGTKVTDIRDLPEQNVWGRCESLDQDLA